MSDLAWEAVSQMNKQQTKTILELFKAKSRIEELEHALRFAAGVISTMPPFDIDHPEEALKWIMEEGSASKEREDASA